MHGLNLLDGVILNADVASPETYKYVRHRIRDISVPLVMCDPWYGEIVPEFGDTCLEVTGLPSGTKEAETAFVDWMLAWTRLWSDILCHGGAMYVWGGIGRPGFRPFYGYMSRVERETGLTIANHITWKKKRAYGVKWGYLFVREELAYLTKGDPKKPHCFNIPLTDKLRGYQGYNAKYKAKSDFLRRTNVWEEDGPPNAIDEADAEEYRMADVWDETELLRGKRHICEKVPRVNEIPIEVHTHPGDLVIDLFSGSGSASEAARKLGRRFVAIEKDAATCEKIAASMSANKSRNILVKSEA